MYSYHIRAIPFHNPPPTIIQLELISLSITCRLNLKLARSSYTPNFE